MKCSRCKSALEPDDVYCLNCGKPQREDAAFGAEFEEDFQYDEADAKEADAILESAQPGAQTPARGFWVAFLFAVLFLGAGIVLILSATGIIVWQPPPPPLTVQKSEPDDSANEAGIAANAAPTLPDADLAALSARCEALFLAGNQSYDLDVILDCCPPRARTALLSLLQNDHGCDSEDALRAIFATKAADAPMLRNVRFALDTIGSEAEITQLKSWLLQTLQVDCGEIETLAFVQFLADRNDGKGLYLDESVFYTMGKIDGVWYCLDF